MLQQLTTIFNKHCAETIVSFIDDKFESLSELKEFYELNAMKYESQPGAQGFFVKLKRVTTEVFGESEDAYILGFFQSRKEASNYMLSYAIETLAKEFEDREFRMKWEASVNSLTAILYPTVEERFALSVNAFHEAANSLPEHDLIPDMQRLEDKLDKIMNALRINQ